MMIRPYALAILSAASLAMLSCGEDSSSQTPFDIDDQDPSKAPAPEELGINPKYINYCEMTSDYDDDGTIDSININTFDEQGRLIKSKTMTADGTVTMRLEQTYDEKYRLKKGYITLDHPASFHQEYGVEYNYDTTDRLVSCKSIGSSIDPSIKTIFESTQNYTYDTSNRLKSITDTRKPDNKTTYEYQENKTIAHFKNGQEMSYMAFNFNKNGRLSSMTYPYDGEEATWMKVEWDEHENVQSFTFNRTKTIYAYNTENKLISEQEYDTSKEKFGNKIEILRDNKNNIIKIAPQPRTPRADNRRITRKNNQISIYNEDTNLETALYTYNNSGNLIEYIDRTRLVDGISIVKQSFNYDCFKNKHPPQPPHKYQYNQIRFKQKYYEQPHCHHNNLSHDMSVSNYTTTRHGRLGRILNEFDY